MTAENDATEAEGLLRYIDAAPSPYHAVAEAVTRLEAAGFSALAAADRWPDGPGRHYVARGGSLVAWVVPGGATPTAPFRIVGAHTDSPNLRIKPRPDTGRAGWQQLGVEVYGGALLNSWLDRDLGLSGRVMVDGDQGPVERLVKIDRPLLRVPQLAIHLDREIVEHGLRLNRQQHLSPVWALGSVDDGTFAQFLAEELATPPGGVLGWDVMAHDLTPGTLAGRNDELLSAPRLDNLCSCYAGIRALTEAADDARAVVVLVLFDHEEVGSVSATGADSALLPTVLERSVLARGGDREAWHRAVAASVCASVDMAHGTHPNYVDRHEPDHHIALNGGPVLKINTNQRYATDGATAADFTEDCRTAGVPVQRFVSRSDLPCGSTIGPVTAARLGVPTFDVGVAQLAMHSARELGGAADPGHLVRALTALFLRPPRP